MNKREIMLDILNDCENMSLDYILCQVDKNKDILSMEDLIKIFTYYNQYRKGCPQLTKE